MYPTNDATGSESSMKSVKPSESTVWIPMSPSIAGVAAVLRLQYTSSCSTAVPTLDGFAASTSTTHCAPRSAVELNAPTDSPSWFCTVSRVLWALLWERNREALGENPNPDSAIVPEGG